VLQLTIAVPPATGSALSDAVEQLVAALTEAAPRWPADLPIAAGFDAARAERELRTAAGWAGRCAIDYYLAGNGSTSATVRLVGRAGAVTLAVEVTDTGQLRRSDVTLIG